MSNEELTTSEDTKRKKTFNEFIHSEAGNGFVEKILIIGLFAFVVAAGISAIAGGANDKLDEQTEAIGGVNGAIGGGE